MLIEAKKFKTDVIDYTRSLESNTNSCALNFIWLLLKVLYGQTKKQTDSQTGTQQRNNQTPKINNHTPNPYKHRYTEQ